jgi:hypothetical protein
LEEEENPEWVPPEENVLKETQEDETLDESPSREGENTVEEQIPEYLFKIFIADRGNSRVVVWNELPILPTDESEGGEDDHIEIEDPNLLIGDGDEEDEDDSPEELPSV